MKIPQEVFDVITNGDLKVVYKHFRLLKEELTEQDFNKVRYGINYNFDINDFLLGNFTIKKKKREVMIVGEVINMKDFWTEIEDREDLMRSLIYQNVEISGTLTGRVS